MNTPVLRESGPWLIVMAGWGLAFALACRLCAALPLDNGDTDILGRLLGESRSVLSANLYDEADTFFHKGVAHLRKRAFTNDWIQVWHQAVSPTTHQHTEGGEVAEILPWLKLATRADPHNVEASLVMAFWIDTGLRKPRLARQVLLDTLRENPGEYRVSLELGRLAIQQAQFVEAQVRLTAGLSQWPSVLPADDRQALLDKAEMLILLGFLAEIRGDITGAVTHFKNALAIFPERSYIRQRLGFLESGVAPPDSARDRLQYLVKRTVDDACADEDDGHKEGRHAPESAPARK